MPGCIPCGGGGGGEADHAAEQNFQVFLQQLLASEPNQQQQQHTQLFGVGGGGRSVFPPPPPATVIPLPLYSSSAALTAVRAGESNGNGGAALPLPPLLPTSSPSQWPNLSLLSQLSDTEAAELEQRLLFDLGGGGSGVRSYPSAPFGEKRHEFAFPSPPPLFQPPQPQQQWVSGAGWRSSWVDPPRDVFQSGHPRFLIGDPSVGRPLFPAWQRDTW